MRIQAARNLVAHEERLKKNIAAELHDELSSSLASLRLTLQNILTDDKAIMLQLQKAELEIADLAPKIRQLCFALMPVHLERFGLAQTIKDMADNNNFNALETVISVPKMNLDAGTSLQLFRIIQEIFTNTLKHAQATHCRIAIKKEKNMLVLDMGDDGIGFDLDKMHARSTGIGLSNIKSRVEMLNGRLNLSSRPNSGVHYKIKIPCYDIPKDKNSNS